jgi:hypothetical protein
MGQRWRFLMLLALGYGLAGCASVASISPNDAQYARSGAPRAGEPTLPPGRGYTPLGSDGGGGGGGGGGM